MALTDQQRLRQALGESIPSGGTEADTLFTDVEIQDFLDRGEGDVDKGTYYGWVAKAAAYANMADVQEGTSREMLSDLHKAALEQLKHWGKHTGLIPGLSRNVRIGRVVRR